MPIDPNAGKPADPKKLANIPELIQAYYSKKPDPNNKLELVEFGTSGHRGSSLRTSFNENHILAITQAICDYRTQQNITGPLYLGIDTHALSVPAYKTALEVLVANQVNTMIAEHGEFTPTPVVSFAILTYNKGKTKGLADGIAVTPSHNPPTEGGFKYNPPNGGPAETTITNWIQNRANEYLKVNLAGIKRVPYERAISAYTVHPYNFMKPYIDDLKNVIDMEIIKNSQVSLGADPLGGAGVHYWQPIADRYGLNLTVVNTKVDPTFSFMTYDWDGQIRMDPSSPYAMRSLIDLKDQYKVAFACDTDHDRHGIVTKSVGLMPPNHYLSAAIYYLFQHRPQWRNSAQIGKTLVSSSMIDRVAKKINRKVYEVPVGFKWFVEGLLSGSLAFVGEESAGGTFARIDGSVWTTDKDGIILSLLAAEMTARLGKDPGEVYQALTHELGEPLYDRVEAPATPEQKAKLKNLSPAQITQTELAGEKIEAILTKAPGDSEPIGGVKVVSKNGWFAARPSGTENIYKIYAESFVNQEHLHRILAEAQSIVDKAL
jgi:phosphoglucomutase